MTDAKQIYTIDNMNCVGCAREIEKSISRLDGVNAVQVDFIANKMQVDGDVSFLQLKNRVEALGKAISLPEQESSQERLIHGSAMSFWDFIMTRHETRLALIGGGIVLCTLVATLVGLPTTFATLSYVGGMLITLIPILKSGINGLRLNRQFNVNLLMSIAAIGAVFIGEYLEGAMVIFLFAIGEALESYTADRARRSIKSLLALKPATATLIHGTQEALVPVETLNTHDLILVKAGEDIPMDGRITQGSSHINQAPITGESIPVEKSIGDEVFAGSINGAGTLIVEVTQHAKDNTLNRIIALVEEAQSVRAPSQRVIDRFASWYTPIIILLALIVTTIPPLLFNAPLLDTPDQHGWLYRALAMLVIACPCALVISTPVTVISAITTAAQHGVLIKGGAHLEALGKIKAFAFDKTGTLTSGHLQVTKYRQMDCDNDIHDECCDDILALANALERRSAHPLAKSVVRAAAEYELAGVYDPAEQVETMAGFGIRGIVNGRKITIGSHHLFDTQFPHDESLCAEIHTLEKNGQTMMLLADQAQVRGYIGLTDTIRGSSRDVIATLNDIASYTVMLTGDNYNVAQSVGAAVGMMAVHADLLPDQKVDMVKQLGNHHGSVAMVGDGINDTPALAAATVGIAMGGAGSPQALESADVVLMADDLRQLPFAVKLSRFARRLIYENVVLSFGIKLMFLILAFLGLTSLWVAILADVGMAFLVTLNGMRTLRYDA